MLAMLTKGMIKLREWIGAGKGRAEAIAAVCIKANGKAVTRSAVLQWKAVPIEYVEAIEALTGISRHDLRPDVSQVFAA